MMRRMVFIRVVVPNAKLYCMLADQRREKDDISQAVLLYLDIVNDFYSPNHRAIFFILEAKGFSADDINLFRRPGCFLDPSW